MILLPKAYWEVRDTLSKGHGLFAKKTLAKGTIIGDYIGKVLHPRDAIVDENNFYLMYYHNRAAISPDLTKSGIHLLNHSCIPNCGLYIYRGHTLAFALRHISSNEELLLNYALAPKDDFCEPCEHACLCGNLRCIGTMHLSQEVYVQWRKLTNTQAKETKRERIRYGKALPVLDSYPKKIPEEYIKKVTEVFSERML